MLKLEFVLPELKVKKNIVMVGSSARTIGKKKGGLIDEHKEVIRFNRAITKGHEVDVGSKTTLRVVNNHTFNGNSMSVSWGGQEKDFVKNLRDVRLLYFAEDLMPFWEREKKVHSSTEVYLFNYGVVSAMNIRFGLSVNHKPSVGVGFIMLAIVSGAVPNVVGFDTEIEDQRTHYWSFRPPASGYHDVNSEKLLLKRLVKQKLINFL